MKCPFCSADNTRVVDSRLVVEYNKIRRRRLCEQCSKRFTTYEMIEESFPMLIKSDGRRESYHANKVRAGINRAIEKRPISAQQVDDILNYVENELRGISEKEIAAKQIGDWIMEKLIEIDEVAYVRFASVYRSFQDISAFQKEIEKLQQSFKRG